MVARFRVVEVLAAVEIFVVTAFCRDEILAPAPSKAVFRGAAVAAFTSSENSTKGFFWCIFCWAEVGNAAEVCRDWIEVNIALVSRARGAPNLPDLVQTSAPPKAR